MSKSVFDVKELRYENKYNKKDQPHSSEGQGERDVYEVVYRVYCRRHPSKRLDVGTESEF